MNVLKATKRTTVSSGQINKLRSEGFIPAVLYGGKQSNLNISLKKMHLKDLIKTETFMSKVFDLEIDGSSEKALPREIAYDPVSDEPIHIDFIRIVKGSKLILEIPVKFINSEKSPGLKKGGVLNIVRRKVELKCPTENIPNEIIVDLNNIEINTSLKISSVTLPEGVMPTITDRASLQRGYQVYNEVCAGCHSIKHLSYRNLSEKGGPEFSVEEAEAFASQFEVEDGPNSDGEMFMRAARLSDKFASPYPNIEASTAANGGAYPPDMSVLSKARTGGADYIYSLLLGYEEAPVNFELDDGVYYNKYMPGNKIKMSEPISDESVEYSDGTNATKAQIAKDVTAFLVWASEPHLESQHRMGFKVIIYLIILITLVYMSKQKVWSRFGSKNLEKEEVFDKVEKVVTKYEGEDPKTFK